MKKVVVKIGGSLAIDEAKLSDFVAGVAMLPGMDAQIAVVHGGGKDINENIALLKEQPTFIDGLRVTTPSIMKMVEMTLSGHVNKKLVRMLIEKGCKAVGISGVDASLFEVEKRRGNVDLGLVGDITKVNPEIIVTLFGGGFVPVVSPISIGQEPGGPSLSWNVNADTAASELAVALKADQFVLVSDVPGVMDGNKNVIPELNEETAEKLIAEGVINGGMIPKVRESFKSIKRGLKAIHIVGWKDAEHFTKQINGDLNYGTILH
ncbi:MAG: acetylglutamate kinase [Fibrobacteraceae bacterium]|nr:acetylglutamate kinase [Fibrobacteraceae bacterium]